MSTFEHQPVPKGTLHPPLATLYSSLGAPERAGREETTLVHPTPPSSTRANATPPRLYRPSRPERELTQCLYLRADVLEANANGILLFNKWDASEVEVKDISLTDYIQVRNAVLLPHTAGRYATKQFRKAQMPIVERLVNRLVTAAGHSSADLFSRHKSLERPARRTREARDSFPGKRGL